MNVINTANPISINDFQFEEKIEKKNPRHLFYLKYGIKYFE